MQSRCDRDSAYEARQDVFDYIEFFYNPQRKQLGTACCHRSLSNSSKN